MQACCHAYEVAIAALWCRRPTCLLRRLSTWCCSHLLLSTGSCCTEPCIRWRPGSPQGNGNYGGISPITIWSIGNIQCESKLLGRWQQRCGRSLSVLQQLVRCLLGVDAPTHSHNNVSASFILIALVNALHCTASRVKVRLQKRCWFDRRQTDTVFTLDNPLYNRLRSVYGLLLIARCASTIFTETLLFTGQRDIGRLSYYFDTRKKA